MDRALDLSVGLLPGRCTVGCPLLQVCTLGWVKCREHISLLIILCIIVYVTNKAHPSLICIVCVKSNQIKSNQITFIVTSPQHKCLGEWNSYERAPDSAKKKNNNNSLHMDRQCKKTTNNLQMDRQCKKTTTIYIWTDSVKKQQTIYIWTDSAKKLHWSIYSAPDSAKKQQQFTYGQTVQKNNNNLHMDSTYLQTIQKTMCKIHIHILSTHSVL